MKNINRFFPALLLVLLTITLSAQPEDLTKDKTFFETQLPQYQRWLDHSGIGWALKVQSVEVQSQQLALYLQFPTENSDSVSAIWTQVSSDYTALKTGMRLEQALYYKMLQLMEVRQSAANVQLFDTYDMRREPCFYRGIYMKESVLQIDSTGCKSKKLDIHLSPSDLRGTRKPSVSEFQRVHSQTVVFDNIYRYAQLRYSRKTCENRIPTIGPSKVDGNILRFEVTDLCREVLHDAQNNALCSFLNRYFKECNWIKREKLNFIFIYQKTDGGVVVKCEVDGKVGSGFYDEVGRGGYLDMEIDFNGYLTDYAEKLQAELKKVLIAL